MSTDVNVGGEMQSVSLDYELERGPIIPISIKMAIPIIIAQMLLLLYASIDTYFISLIDKSSTALMSGIGLIFPIHMLFNALAFGLYTGISSLVARGFGEKNQVVIDKSADSGLFTAIITAIITVSILYIFKHPLLHILAGNSLSQEAINNGLQFFSFIIPGLGLMLIYVSLLGVLQGQGISRYFGISMMISTITNIILDPILIFGFKMGVAGAGLATSISVLISLLLVAFVFLPSKSIIKVNWNAFDIDKRLVLEIIRIGTPQVLSLVSLSLTMIFLNNLVGTISESSMNSWALVGRMDEFILLVGYAFGSATLTLIGQNYGRKNLPRILEAYKANIMISLTIATVFALIYNIFASNIFSLFTSRPEIVAGSVLQVRIVSFTYLGIIIAALSTSAFQGTGKAWPGLVIDIIRMGVLTVPLSYMMVYVFHKGVVHIFYVLSAANILTGILSIVWCSWYLRKAEFKNIV